MGLKRYREHFIDGDSDCTIVSDEELAISTAKNQLTQDKKELIQFIQSHPNWEESLIPIHTEKAPPIIQLMEEAAEIAHVGPMAAVAGALADRMKDAMKEKSKTKISVVENGGEIIIESSEDVIIGLYVLTTALKAQIGFKFEANSTPLGVGTSSGQFGHAFSFGEADAVSIFAKNAALGDAAATWICNNVVGKDYEKTVLQALELIDEMEGVSGAFVVRKNFVGQKGQIPPLIRIQGGEEEILEEKFKKV